MQQLSKGTHRSPVILPNKRKVKSKPHPWIVRPNGLCTKVTIVRPVCGGFSFSEES